MIKKLSLHFFLFSFSKGSNFIAPIFAATILNSTSYGIFEFSLSIAYLIYTFITMGGPSILAYDLVKNKYQLIDVVKKYSLALIYSFAILSLLLILFSANKTLILISGLISILISGNTIGGYLKGTGKGAYANIFESSVYITSIILFIFLYLNEINILKTLFVFPLSGIIIGLFLNKIIYYDTIEINKNTFSMFIKRGSAIMISSFLSILFLNLPKIILSLNSFEAVSFFSIYFRWAALCLIFHQFIFVVFFKKIFSLDFHQFQKICILILSLVWSFSLVLIFIMNYLYSSGFDIIKVPEPNLTFQIIMSLGISCWILSALIEGLIYRQEKSIYHGYSNIIGIISFFFFLFMMTSIYDDYVQIVVSSWCLGYIAIIFSQITFLESKLKGRLDFKLLKICIFISLCTLIYFINL